MKSSLPQILLPVLAALIALAGLNGCVTVASKNASAKATERRSLWIDSLRGEELSFEELLDELQKSRVIYLGEFHTITRHHELQNAILEGLAKRGAKLVLAMEQFEYMAQPALDRFNQKQTDLSELITESDWSKRWRGHTNYHALLATARAHAVPLLALNTRAETIRAVGRQGLDKLTPEQRAELPAEIQTDDPTYHKLMNQLLGVHMAFDLQKLKPVFEAQVSRDETMATRLTDYLNTDAGKGRIAVVICGKGHCEYGLGMPDRVNRRAPDLAQRIVLFSESGDLKLSEAERKQAREIEITHEFLRSLGRASGDFLNIVEMVPPTP